MFTCTITRIGLNCIRIAIYVCKSSPSAVIGADMTVLEKLFERVYYRKISCLSLSCHLRMPDCRCIFEVRYSAADQSYIDTPRSVHSASILLL